ncbi:MAG: hypothetical protein ACK57J_02245 [Rubrivivax sp.]
MTSLPLFIAPAVYDDADAAFAQVDAIYRNSVTHLRQSLQRFVAGQADVMRTRSFYPMVRLSVDTVARRDSLKS